MSIAAIQEWLDSPTRNYGVGVQYFSKYSTNSFLKKLFLKSEDDYNFNRLMRELQSIVDDAINPPKPEVPPIIESDAAPAAPEEDVPAVPEEYTKFGEGVAKVDVSKLPEELQLLVAEKGQLYRQCSFIHSRLMLIETDQERAKKAEELVMKYRRIQEIWIELDYFEQYKIIRPKSKNAPDVSKMTLVKLIHHRNNLRTKVSRYRNQPESDLYRNAVAELEAVKLLIAKKEDDKEGDDE